MMFKQAGKHQSKWRLGLLIAIAAGLIMVLAAEVFDSPRKAHPPLDRTAWDTPIPAGEEVNLITLNKLKGETSPVPFEQIKNAVGVLALAKLEGLVITAKDVELYRVKVVAPGKDHEYPPDMWGTGPFFVVKQHERFFRLTETNYARLFGPENDVQHAQRYLQIYDELFGSRFSYLVTDGFVPFLKDRREVPEPTEIRAVNGGFEAKLIWLNPHHVRRFVRQRIFLHNDGTVDEGKSEVILETGPGIAF
jgi:hypothetical protein